MTSSWARLVFDRGTVVVEAATPAGVQLSSLSWDARVSAYRAPAMLYPRILDGLRQGGHEVSDGVRGAGAAPGDWGPVDLRPYQEAAIDAWELQGRRGVVVLPTGSGKTHVALGVMARTKMRTLCLVPTRALVEQWTAQIARRYAACVGCYGDGRHDLAPVTVATFESAYRHMDRLGNQFDLLVVDEAHHFGHGIRDEALEMSTAMARIGLTATPPGSAGSRLSELVGPQVFELTVGDLTGTFLASFDLVTLHLELSMDERARYERARAQFLEVHREFRRMVPNGAWSDFVKLAARTDVGRKALAAWRESQQIITYPDSKRRVVESLLARHRDSRVLVFTADNHTAYSIARQNLVMPLTCDIDRGERSTALAGFQNGHLHALVSARVLNEGIDVPDADVAIVVGGTQGEREHVQRVGRLLRPREGKRALVYELVCGRTIETRLAKRRQRALAPQRSAQL